jgi:hypothetical protein
MRLGWALLGSKDMSWSDGRDAWSPHGQTLRDGCVVTDSGIDKQAARARRERVRDGPDPVSLATRR